MGTEQVIPIFRFQNKSGIKHSCHIYMACLIYLQNL